MSARFITFEGTEGGGKSTQIRILAEKLSALGYPVRILREPGGTPIGEEIRHTLKHSEANAGMTAETELLLMNASRAQLVREIIRPALAAGEIILCDRFFDSTVAYQGYGRGLDLGTVQAMINFAVGDIRPDLTFLLVLSVAASEIRRQERGGTNQGGGSTYLPAAGAGPASPSQRDRFEQADRAFFERVERGFQEIAQADPARVQVIDAAQSIDKVSARIWKILQTRLA